MLECASSRADAAAAVAATGVPNFFPRMIAFIEHFHRCGKLTSDQREVLINLVEGGSSAIMSAYHSAKMKDDPNALYEGMVVAANFYLHQNGGNPQRPLERPETPNPYSGGSTNSRGTVSDDDVLDLFEDLVDGGHIPVESEDDLRNIILSSNPYVEAAIELYVANSDVEDFVDTLLRIVRHQDFSAQDAYDQQQTTSYAAESESEEEYEEEEQNYLPTDLKEEEEDEEDEDDEITWESKEGTVRLLGALMDAKVFEYEPTKKLSLILLSDHASMQQEVLVAAYQLYEQDANVEEFVDTCKRVLKQLAVVDEEKKEAYRHIVCQEGRFSDYQQALLLSMWNGLDPRVMAAWDVFEHDRNEAEFVDTLSRVLSHEFEIEEEEEEERNESTVGTTSSHKRNYSEIINHDDENEEDDTTYKEVMHQVIELMVAENHVDEDGAHTLLTLVNEGHTVVGAAYDAFSHDEDIDELMDTLRTVSST